MPQHPRRALFLSPESPFPPIGGGPLRSASLAHYLASHFVLDVITFRQPGAPDPREAFPPRLANAIQVIELPYHSKSLAARAVRNLRRAALGRPPLLDRFSGFEDRMHLGDSHYDLAIIEHVWCAPYETTLRPHCERVCLDLHNIESEWHASLAAAMPPPASQIHHRFSEAYRNVEREWLPRFDLVLTTSEADAVRVGAHAQAVVYPNAIPMIARPPKGERHEIIFTGNLEYEPNLAAIRFFRDEVWPLLYVRWPGLTWTIAGKNGHAVSSLLGNTPSCEVISPIDDAVARIAEAKVAIVPLRAGSGTRLKILEAWAAGTPVVSTSLGAEGLGVIHEWDILIADSPEDFATNVSRLLANECERKRIGDAGRLVYERKFTWNVVWETIDRFLRPNRGETPG